MEYRRPKIMGRIMTIGSGECRRSGSEDLIGRCVMDNFSNSTRVEPPCDATRKSM